MTKPSAIYRSGGNPKLRKTTQVPANMKHYNVRSWGKADEYLGSREDGQATLEELTDSVGVHTPPAYQRAATQRQTNRGFILHCVDLGWLEVCQ